MLFLLILLALAIGRSAMRLLLLLRARNKHRLLARMHGPGSDTSGLVGISVLCSGVTDSAEIEKLFLVEYTRYEVVVAMNGVRDAEAFRSLIARYRLFRVGWNGSDEWPVNGIRSLWRSRKRCFRRLVVVDVVEEDREADYRACAAVADYDYLLRIGAGMSLLPGAIERRVLEIEASPDHPPQCIRTRVGVRAELVSREAVVEAGGFGGRLRHRIKRRYCRHLWEPLLTDGRRAWLLRWWLPFFLLSTAVAAVAVALGWWGISAFAATVGVLILFKVCISRVIDDISRNSGYF